MLDPLASSAWLEDLRHYYWKTKVNLSKVEYKPLSSSLYAALMRSNTTGRSGAISDLQQNLAGRKVQNGAERGSSQDGAERTAENKQEVMAEPISPWSWVSHGD